MSLVFSETQRQAEGWVGFFPVERRGLRVPDGAGGLPKVGVGDGSGGRWVLLVLVLIWEHD